MTTPLEVAEAYEGYRKYIEKCQSDNRKWMIDTLTAMGVPIVLRPMTDPEYGGHWFDEYFCIGEKKGDYIIEVYTFEDDDHFCWSDEDEDEMPWNYDWQRENIVDKTKTKLVWKGRKA